jgi:hypothetical protein
VLDIFFVLSKDLSIRVVFLLLLLILCLSFSNLSPIMAGHDFDMGKSANSYTNEHHQLNDLGSMDHRITEGFTANDQRDMQRMGKKQEFRRNFHFITTIGFTCCVMGQSIIWPHGGIMLILLRYLGNSDDFKYTGSSCGRFSWSVLELGMVLYWANIHCAILGRDVLDGANSRWSIPLGL